MNVERRGVNSHTPGGDAARRRSTDRLNDADMRVLTARDYSTRCKAFWRGYCFGTPKRSADRLSREALAWYRR